MFFTITYISDAQSTSKIDRETTSQSFTNVKQIITGETTDIYPQRTNQDYQPDNNPVTFDEDPTNYPLERPHTYINVQGTEVQSPTQYNSIPTDACAICRDGSYSFSQNRRGTCSRHGGVAKWLK